MELEFVTEFSARLDSVKAKRNFLFYHIGPELDVELSSARYNNALHLDIQQERRRIFDNKYHWVTTNLYPKFVEGLTVFRQMSEQHTDEPFVQKALGEIDAERVRQEIETAAAEIRRLYSLQ